VNHIKSLGQGRGATVEIVLANKDGKQVLGGAINSGAKSGLNAASLKQLKALGANIAPRAATRM
jgi:hypothetical protein